MQTVAIIQARMGSTRLPGKVLMRIGDRVILEHIYRRAAKATTIDKVVIATTFETEDLDIVRWAQLNKLNVLRGGTSADDVLGRYYDAAVLTGAECVVRLTGDNPFADPDAIDAVVGRLHADPPCDYASNVMPPTLPDGLDVEAFTFGALQAAHIAATSSSDREHVTPYLRDSGKFVLSNVLFEPDLSSYRLTVDELEDLELARCIFKELGEDCDYRAAAAYLDVHADTAKLNSGKKRNARYLKV